MFVISSSLTSKLSYCHLYTFTEVKTSHTLTSRTTLTASFSSSFIVSTVTPTPTPEGKSALY